MCMLIMVKKRLGGGGEGRFVGSCKTDTYTYTLIKKAKMGRKCSHHVLYVEIM